jgi:hypothetical protein
MCSLDYELMVKGMASPPKGRTDGGPLAKGKNGVFPTFLQGLSDFMVALDRCSKLWRADTLG